MAGGIVVVGRGFGYAGSAVGTGSVAVIFGLFERRGGLAFVDVEMLAGAVAAGVEAFRLREFCWDGSGLRDCAG